MSTYTSRIVSRSVPALLVALSIVVNAAAAPPYIQITPRPPKDLASRNASQEDLAKFAWQEFLALNWKASVDAQNPPSSSNQRGLPDLKWSYSNQAPQFPNPLVWQTFAQTTELRPNFPLSAPISVFCWTLATTNHRSLRLHFIIFRRGAQSLNL